MHSNIASSSKGTESVTVVPGWKLRLPSVPLLPAAGAHRFHATQSLPVGKYTERARAPRWYTGAVM